MTSQDEGTLLFFIPSILCVIGNKLLRRHICVAVKTLDYNKNEKPVRQAHVLRGIRALVNYEEQNHSVTISNA